MGKLAYGPMDLVECKINFWESKIILMGIMESYHGLAVGLRCKVTALILPNWAS